VFRSGSQRLEAAPEGDTRRARSPRAAGGAAWAVIGDRRWFQSRRVRWFWRAAC